MAYVSPRHMAVNQARVVFNVDAAILTDPSLSCGVCHEREPMANLNKTIMQHAQKQVGIWEWAGSENNPLVLAMFAEAGHSEIKQDAVPWCAAFVGSVLLRAGTKGTGSLLARSYLDWGQKIPLSEAKEGDVVILSGKAS